MEHETMRGDHYSLLSSDTLDPLQSALLGDLD
jgi:hypothetical protein